MNIQAIKQPSFEAKKFRLPIKYLDFTEPKYGLCAPRIKVKVDRMAEYENPEAEKIYNEAMKIKDPFEKGKKLSEMGHYKLVDLNFEERIRKFFGLWRGK